MIIKPTQATVDQVRAQLSLTASFFRAAAIQMASGPVVAGNLKEAARLVELAAAAGAKVIGLPEYFCIMGMQAADKVKVRERYGEGPIQSFLSELSAKHRIYLIAGTIPIDCGSESKIRNTCLAYGPDGKVVARYDKIHLFGFKGEKEEYNESQTIEPGSEVVVFDTPYGRVGLSVCYDLRFPELYRAMNQQPDGRPVDMIFLPSAFTDTTGKAHWETLVRARAIENQCYFIAPAQGGYHVSGRETHGDSMIVDPWGTILDRLPRGSGVVVAGISPQHQADVRKKLPALAHRTIGMPA
jgi:deaminated glutathione amidase